MVNQEITHKNIFLGTKPFKNCISFFCLFDFDLKKYGSYLVSLNIRKTFNIGMNLLKRNIFYSKSHIELNKYPLNLFLSFMNYIKRKKQKKTFFLNRFSELMFIFFILHNKIKCILFFFT